MNPNKLRGPFPDFFTLGVPVKTFHEDEKGFVRWWVRVCVFSEAVESNTPSCRGWRACVDLLCSQHNAHNKENHDYITNHVGIC